jgi:hypothetical protein
VSWGHRQGVEGALMVRRRGINRASRVVKWGVEGTLMMFWGCIEGGSRVRTVLLYLYCIVYEDKEVRNSESVIGVIGPVMGC